jgi:hypothetical protein
LKKAHINDTGADPFIDGIDRRKTVDPAKTIVFIGLERMIVAPP